MCELAILGTSLFTSNNNQQYCVGLPVIISKFLRNVISNLRPPRINIVATHIDKFTVSGRDVIG